jgi:transcriptional antiterminator RfaH
VNWYVIRSKAHKEAHLEKELEARDVHCFFPYLKVNPVNPRSKKIRPYFPNYLFVQADLEEAGLSFLKWVPYSQGLVQFGGEPAVVPESLVHGIMKRLDAINAAGGLKPKRFETGEIVWVTEGYFQGYEGIFDTYLDGRDRVRILLDLLTGRKIPLELNQQQIAYP